MSEGLLHGIGRAVVLVDDHDTALDFYGDTLDMDVLFDEELGGYRYLHVGVPGQEGVGLWLMAPVTDGAAARVGDQTGPHPMLVLYTGDLDAVRDRLDTAGAPVWDERDEPAQASLHTRDPFGNVLVIAEIRAVA